ncbi:hypothetical protein I4U23_003777 [Adineta vaga]|nr:hypothetical protein I4U23_003777 [Adineta vaga]
MNIVEEISLNSGSLDFNHRSTPETSECQSPYLSISSIHENHSPTENNQITSDTPPNHNQYSTLKLSTLFQGLTVGLLVGGLILAIVLSMWLTLPQETVSSKTSLTIKSTATTTTAFQCLSPITSILESYTKTNCLKNNWHTFTKYFSTSYTGMQTLVFSFVNIKHAEMYLTNIKVYNNSNVQLLINGDFSSSSGLLPTNWLKCSDFGQVASMCTVNASIACYTISVQGGTISQSFAVVFGTNYTMQFDLYHTSTTGNSDQIALDVSIV